MDGRAFDVRYAALGLLALTGLPLLLVARGRSRGPAVLLLAATVPTALALLAVRLFGP